MKSIKVIVRDYKPEDVQDLANIYYHTIHNINVKDYTKEQINVWAPETSLRATYWAKKFEITKPFVATIDHTIVGFVEFELDGHIDCFYCHHEWIGYGVGSSLMNAVFENARQKGILRIFVEASITACPFFERHGFHVIQEQQVLLQDIALTNYKMEKLFT